MCGSRFICTTRAGRASPAPMRACGSGSPRSTPRWRALAAVRLPASRGAGQHRHRRARAALRGDGYRYRPETSRR
jgi:hypothetical protein